MPEELTRCPSCNSDKVRRYFYGHHFTGDQKKYLGSDHRVDGGSARFHCDNCGTDFGEAEKSDNQDLDRSGNVKP